MSNSEALPGLIIALVVVLIPFIGMTVSIAKCMKLGKKVKGLGR